MWLRPACIESSRAAVVVKDATAYGRNDRAVVAGQPREWASIRRSLSFGGTTGTRRFLSAFGADLPGSRWLGKGTHTDDLSGIGMGMFFAPVANVVLSAVRPQEEGKASGTNNAIREVGGVLGVAVLASIFARAGGYESPATFNDGLVPALWVGAVAVGIGAVVALLIPRKRRPAEALVMRPDELVAQPEAA